jgi:hypothetical protein
MYKKIAQNVIVTGVITFTLTSLNKGLRNFVLHVWLHSWLIAASIAIFLNLCFFPAIRRCQLIKKKLNRNKNNA